MKAIVSDKIPEEVSSKLLAECNSEIPVRMSMQKRDSDLISSGSVNPGLPKHATISADREYMQTLQCAQRSFIITDPGLPDNPITFASPGFLELTKYSLDDVIGRNCRFMQGPRTDPAQLGVLRKGIIEGKDTSVTLMNYKKDGTVFWNQIFVAIVLKVPFQNPWGPSRNPLKTPWGPVKPQIGPLGNAASVRKKCP